MNKMVFEYSFKGEKRSIFYSDKGEVVKVEILEGSLSSRLGSSTDTFLRRENDFLLNAYDTLFAWDLLEEAVEFDSLPPEVRDIFFLRTKSNVLRARELGVRFLQRYIDRD